MMYNFTSSSKNPHDLWHEKIGTILLTKKLYSVKNKHIFV